MEYSLKNKKALPYSLLKNFFKKLKKALPVSLLAYLLIFFFYYKKDCFFLYYSLFYLQQISLLENRNL